MSSIRYNPPHGPQYSTGYFAAGGPGYLIRKNPEGEKSKLPLVLAGVLGVAAIGAGLYFLLRKSPDGKKPGDGGKGITGGIVNNPPNSNSDFQPPNPGTGTGITATGGSPPQADAPPYVDPRRPPSPYVDPRRPPSADVLPPPRPASALPQAPSDWAVKNAIVKACEAAWQAAGENINTQALPAPAGWSPNPACAAKPESEQLDCANTDKYAKWFCFGKSGQDWTSCVLQNGDPPLAVYRYKAVDNPVDNGQYQQFDGAMQSAAQRWLVLYGNQNKMGEPMSPCNIVMTVGTVQQTARAKELWAEVDTKGTKWNAYDEIYTETPVPRLPWPMLNPQQRLTLAKRIALGMPND